VRFRWKTSGGARVADVSEVTLLDLLRPGLKIVFVGINPSLFSAQRGHYFARTTNRFWPCLSRSVLSLEARQALGVDILKPEHDRVLPDYGFGFTDLVKRPTARADQLDPAELAAGVVDLAAKLEREQPRIACFHGITGFRYVHRVLAAAAPAPQLGEQPWRLGPSRLFVIPNPSPANAHATPAAQTAWYDRLAAELGFNIQ
jgi:double-stranded uracil-DNA glycosylase